MIGGALDHISYPIAKEFYNIFGDGFKYVATRKLGRTNLGYSSFEESSDFSIKSYDSIENKNKAVRYINEADCVIFGSAPEELIRHRLYDKKLTFRFTERLFKEPFTIKNFLHRIISSFLHFRRYPMKKTYILCAGAYVSNDFSQLKLFKNRCFKWAYFTEVSGKNYDELIGLKRKNRVLELIWVARFIPVKHPEIVLRLAVFLKSAEISFHITMIGTGDILNEMIKMADDLSVLDKITFKGALSPQETKHYMEMANISLFTSDRREGWGAVVNEAMGAGCATIASCNAGSPPFLIKHRENGLLFDIDDEIGFQKSVLEVIQDQRFREELSSNAYKDIHSLWTAKNAAASFVKLCGSIENGGIQPCNDGPCSIATVLKDGYFKKE